MSQSPQGRDDRVGDPPKGNTGSAGQRTHIHFWDKTFTFSVSLPKLIFGSLFSLFLLVWVFIFGIMLGRGHNPEDLVPDLAKVMPTPIPQTETATTGIMDTVLQPQELKYHETLKAKDPPPPSPATLTQSDPTPQNQPQQTRTEAPKPTSSPATPTADKTAPQRTAQVASNKDKSDQDKTVYNYIYQVAAFNNVASANTLQKRLQDGGFSAQIAQNMFNGTTWYRILVSFKGTQDDLRTLRTKLSTFGIPNVILRGKAPAN